MQERAVDYTPFLRVFEDGNIWWGWREAIRLGAGFLPVYNDRTMEVELQPRDERAKVNERFLLGAAKDTRLGIELPKRISRDGFHYVEAEDFLHWLNQYLNQTGVEGITFPLELARAVRDSKANSALSRQPVENLVLALEDCFDKPLKDLSEAKRELIRRDITLIQLWDHVSPTRRKEMAAQCGAENNQADDPEFDYGYNLALQLRELRKKQAEWEAVDALTASDLAKKETRCKELGQEIARLEAERDKPVSTATQDQRTRPAANQQPAKGGRRKSQLRLGVEAFCQIKLREGQTDILQPGAIDIFMSQLRRAFNNYDEIAEHIANIRTVGGVMRVYVQDPPDDDPKVKKKNENPDGYTKTAVSKILNDLRKKFPLE